MKDLKETNRLLDEYGFGPLTIHSKCLNSSVYFVLTEREIAQQETIEQLEALILSRIKVSLKSKRLFSE